MLLEITERMVSVLDIEVVLDVVMEFVARAFQVDRGLLMVADALTGELRVRRTHNLDSRDEAEAEGYSRSAIADVIAGKGPLIVSDALLDPATSSRQSIVGSGIRTLICLPLTMRGRIIGALYLDNRRGGTVFTEGALTFLQALANLSAIAIHNADLYTRSIHDGLTGLFNHTFFESEFEREIGRARRSGGRFGLLVLDVDRFKSINDTHGHSRGSELLTEISEVVAQTLRTTDLPARRPAGDGETDPEPLVGRYGGDEFELLLPDTDGAGTARAAARLAEAAREHVFLTGSLDLRITLSIGGAIFPDHGRTAQEVFLRADEALYQVKQAGRNGFRIAGGAG